MKTEKRVRSDTRHGADHSEPETAMVWINAPFEGDHRACSRRQERGKSKLFVDAIFAGGAQTKPA